MLALSGEYFEQLLGTFICDSFLSGSSTANRGWPNLMQREEMSPSPLRREHHASLSTSMWLHCKKSDYVCWLKIMKPNKTTKETIHFKFPGMGIICSAFFLKLQRILKLLISDVMHQ